MSQPSDDLRIIIDTKKSTIYNVRGILIRDGIRIPFTVTRRLHFGSNGGAAATLAVRSKGRVINRLPDKEFIKNKLRLKARCWWVDGCKMGAF